MYFLRFKRLSAALEVAGAYWAMPPKHGQETESKN